MKTRKRREPILHADPARDPHSFVDAGEWSGTVIGIDLNIEQGIAFADLLNQIRQAYFMDIKTKRDYANKIRFSP